MTCGIELKGNEARIVVMDGTRSSFEIVSSAPKKIKLEDSNNQEDVQGFLNEFNAFVEQFGIEKIGVKERATKGKFAGGSVSFKMEGLIQSGRTKVILIHSRTIKSKIKGAEIDLSSVNKYQEEAMKIAWILMD